MNEQERQLDLLVAELEAENRKMRTQNERLERELTAVTAERDVFKEALERVLTISRVAIWNRAPDGVAGVGAKARNKEIND
mgnify:CR=1 FL=1